MSGFSGGSGWRQSTPGEWMKTAAAIGAQTGQLFASSFNQAAGRAQEDKQFDAKMDESARQFNAQNPAMPQARNSQPGPVKPEAPQQPAYDINGGGWLQTANPGARWDGQPQPNWLSTPLKKNSPDEAISAVLGAKTVAEAADIRAANADWESNASYRKIMDHAFKSPVERDQAAMRAERFKLEQQRVQNQSLANKILVDDAKMFNTRISTIDPEDRAEILSMSNNEDGTISADRWKALNMAEQRLKLRKENQAKQAEIEAMQRGDQVTTTITDKGVTRNFKPAPAEKPDTTDAEPTTKDLGDGTTLAWMPGSKSIHVIKKTGEKQPISAYTLFQIGKGLKDQGDSDGTNFMNMAKSLIKGMPVQGGTQTATNAPAAPAASPSKPATKEVERADPNSGRIAVFDEATKSFLRWK
jgi:hypothetical protein